MKADRIVPIEQSPDLLLDYLRKSPRTVQELSTLTAYSAGAVRTRLEMLELDKQAYRVLQGSVVRSRGGSYLWHFGSMPTIVDFVPRAPAPKSELEQKTVTNYQIHSRRDDLVEAFFGPARKEKA